MEKKTFMPAEIQVVTLDAIDIIASSTVPGCAEHVDFDEEPSECTTDI